MDWYLIKHKENFFFAVLLDVDSSIALNLYQHFKVRVWRWRQIDPSKYWYLRVKLEDSIIFLFLCLSDN